MCDSIKKIKFIGVSDPVYMINGKTYDIISIENGWYRIIDEEGEDYLYPPDTKYRGGDETIND